MFVMERRLITDIDQLFLRLTSASNLAAELARVKANVGAPASWRIDPSYTCFYNTEGMTQGEIDTYESTQLSNKSLATSRQKDILAMLAVIVRQKNVSAWNALTTPQKVTAVLAEADLFKTFRGFIDDKV